MSPPLDSQEFTDRAADRPLRLLADRRGVYAVALDGGETGASYDQVYALRPDRLDETRPWLPSLLHRVPRGPAPGFTAERALVWGLTRALLNRAGLRGGPAGDTEAGSAEGDAEGDEWPLKTGDPATQARIRRRSFGLLAAAQRITNGLLARVLETADPAALTLARRFPLDHRWRIYVQSARGPRFAELAESFPVLAAAIALGADPVGAEAARRRVLAGAPLKEAARALDLPLHLRKVKPGAIGHLWPVADFLKPRATLVHGYLPAHLADQRRWLVGLGAALEYGEDYAVWVARNLRQMAAGSLVEVEALIQDLGDWTEASQWAQASGHILFTVGAWERPHGAALIARPFAEQMALGTVQRLSADWHAALAASAYSTQAHAFPKPWYQDAEVDGYAIHPIPSAPELYREGKRMRHCAAIYAPVVARGENFFYSVRRAGRQVATAQLYLSEGSVEIGQVRGPTNQLPPPGLLRALRKWLSAAGPPRLPADPKPKKAGDEDNAARASSSRGSAAKPSGAAPGKSRRPRQGAAGSKGISEPPEDARGA